MPYLTVNQYAKLKGISPQAVYQKIRDKKLKVEYIEKKVIRIPVGEDGNGIQLTK